MSGQATIEWYHPGNIFSRSVFLTEDGVTGFIIRKQRQKKTTHSNQFITANRLTQTDQYSNQSMLACWHCGAFFASEATSCPECNKNLVICSICKKMIEFSDETASCIYCQNLYHYRHLAEWLKIKGQCPICNFKLYEDDIKLVQPAIGKKKDV